MKYVSLILSLLLCLPLGAQQTYRARVVDAETGEALPYVSIYVAAGRGTISNSNGYFVVEIEPTEQLSFRYVGYETKQVLADALPEVVRMRPYTRVLSEVVVRPISADSILERVIKRLESEYKKHEKAQQVYFFRSVLESSHDTQMIEVGAYMIEAFLRAYDAMNARDVIMLSGIQGREGNEKRLNLRFTNVQRHMEVGPKTYDSKSWEKVIKPLDKFSSLKKFYELSSSILHGEDGKEIYCIDCTWTHELTGDLKNTRYITGHIYVEPNTYRMLGFEGRVNNAWQWVNLDRIPSDIRFHITYDHSRGYTSVANLAVEGGNELMRYHVIAFAVGEYKGAKKQQKQQVLGPYNILQDIDNTVCDSTLWTEEIVRRTEEEERIFKKGMESFSLP